MDIANICYKVGKDITYLNSGGCGIFAVLMVKALREKGIRANVVLTNTSWGYYASKKQFYNNNRKKGQGKAGDHYMIKVGNILYDSQNVCEIKDGYIERGWTRYKVEGRIKLSTIEELANNPNSWNYLFDRRHIPTIEKNIKKYLS